MENLSFEQQLDVANNERSQLNYQASDQQTLTMSAGMLKDKAVSVSLSTEKIRDSSPEGTIAEKKKDERKVD